MTVSAEAPARDAMHAVEFYDDHPSLVTSVAGFVAPALLAGDPVLVVATGDHRAAIDRALLAMGADVLTAKASREYVSLDAAETLERFMVNGQPSPEQFRETVGGLVGHLGAGGRPVRVFGEMVALLWNDGNVLAALALEGLWNDLSRDHSFSLLCAYPSAQFPGGATAAGFQDVCALHSDALGPATRASRTFAPAPGAPRAARRFVVDTLAGWAVEGVAADAAIVTSEMATNAVLHARSAFDVTVSVEDGVVTLAVGDHSPRQPTRRAVSDDSQTGRGLRLIAAVSRCWGTDPRAGGKVVWAELAGRSRAQATRSTTPEQ